MKLTNKFSGFLLSASLLAFIFIAVLGTISNNWWTAPIWLSTENEQLFYIFIASGLVIFMVLLKLGISLKLIALLPLGVYAAKVGIGPIFAVLWVWFCATCIGNSLSKRFNAHELNFWSLRNAGIGFALIGLTINALAYLQICTPLLVIFLFTFAAIVSIVSELKDGNVVFSSTDFIKIKRRSCQDSLVGAIVLIGITLIFVVTAMPDIGNDSLAVHLNIAKEVLETGGWEFNVRKYVWAVMPFGADWLYLPPYFLAGEDGARLLNSSMLLAIGFIGFTMLRPTVGSSIALAFPALLFTLPLSILEVSTAFIEAPLTFFMMLALSELLAFQRKGQLFAIGVYLGFACSIKLLGVLILPFTLIGIVFQLRAGKIESLTLSRIIYSSVFFVCIGSAPYLLAYIKTGNPVFPFFNSLFLSPYFDSTSSFTNPLYLTAVDWTTWWDMSIDSRVFGEFSASGALGISVLALAPYALLASFIYRRWDFIACIFAAIGYTFICFLNQAYLRYFFPVLPWLLLPSVWALSKLLWSKHTSVMVIGVLVLIQLLRIPAAYWPLQQFNINWINDRDKTKAYLLRNKPEAIAGQIISSMTGLRELGIIILGLDPVFKYYPINTISDTWYSLEHFQASRNDNNLLASIARSNIGVIVFPVGRGYKYEQEAVSISSKLFSIGNVQVGLVDPEKIYTQELLKNTDFAQINSSWSRNRENSERGGVATTMENPVIQVVSLNNAKRMLLTVHAFCLKGRQFRTQLNWNSIKGELIGTDIQVHECRPEGVVVSRTINKPANADSAVVFATSHSSLEVIISSVSLRISK